MLIALIKELRPNWGVCEGEQQSCNLCGGCPRAMLDEDVKNQAEKQSNRNTDAWLHGNAWAEAGYVEEASGGKALTLQEVHLCLFRSKVSSLTRASDSWSCVQWHEKARSYKEMQTARSSKRSSDMQVREGWEPGALPFWLRGGGPERLLQTLPEASASSRVRAALNLTLLKNGFKHLKLSQKKVHGCLKNENFTITTWIYVLHISYRPWPKLDCHRQKRGRSILQIRTCSLVFFF